jgi:hypothetical protein
MRGDGRYFSTLPALLRDIPGIDVTRTNAVVGSAVIEHDVPLARLKRVGWDRGAFLLALDEPNPGQAADLPVVQLTHSRAVAQRRPAARLYRALRDGHSRSAIENIVHGYAAFRAAKDPLLGALFLGAGALQIVRGDVLSSILALTFRTLDRYQPYATPALADG